MTSRDAVSPHNREDLFFRRIALAMAATIVAGFLVQFLAGRSTFAARPLVHVHGLIFMGWTALFSAQAWLATRGPLSLHRRLGKVAALWLIAMVPMGVWITADTVRLGVAPFFFRPQFFLIANPVNILLFAVLIIAALKLRRRTDWHKRLQIGAMACIMGPAFGRLLPSPLLIPYTFEIALIAGLIFPAIGALRDKRLDGRVHPAWWWSICLTLATIPIAHVIAATPLGDALYAAVTAGNPGASLPGMSYPVPPPPFR